MKIRYLLIIITAFSSCAARPPLTFDYSSENGVLIGSFSRINGKPRFNQYTIYLTDSNGTKQELTIKPELIWSVKYPNDFDDGEVSGSLFSLTLPPGTYEFNDYFNLYQVTTSRYRYFYPSEEFSIPITIKPGTVNYLGEVRFYPKLKGKFKKEPKFPLGNYADGGQYEIIDNSERDIPLLRKKFKELATKKIENIVPTDAKIPALEERK